MTLITINIEEELYKKLLERKRENESMSDVIARILNIHIEPQDIKSGSNKISEILKNQKPWKQPSLEFQKQLREEWE